MNRARVGLVLGPLMFAAFCLLPDGTGGLSPVQAKMLAVLALMVTWWVTEAVPLAATAMLPLALYPLLGILPSAEAAAPFANPVLFLFVGGFLIALSMQKWHLHERLAAMVVLRAGTKPRVLLFGFVAVAAFFSMWVSNTATTMMLLPVAMSVLSAYKGRTEEFAMYLLLSIAYASSIGGMATPIGTAPNAIMLGMAGEILPGMPRITFARWMFAAAPVAAVLTLLVWGYFAFRLRRFLPEIEAPARETFAERLRAMGPMSAAERRVAFMACATGLLWIFRADIVLGDKLRIPGWGGFLPWSGFPDDGTVAMAMALLLFVLPAGKEKGRLLDWEWAAKLPWDVILLLGGGFALARGFAATGLDTWLGGRLEPLGQLQPVLLVGGMCLLLVFLTEVSSNTAVTSATLPVLAATALAAGIHPLALMFPATLACSCAFMLPTATPPNAIVFAAGHIRIPDMTRVGFVLNILVTVALTALSFLVIYPMLGITFTKVPSWLP